MIGAQEPKMHESTAKTVGQPSACRISVSPRYATLFVRSRASVVRSFPQRDVGKPRSPAVMPSQAVGGYLGVGPPGKKLRRTNVRQLLVAGCSEGPLSTILAGTSSMR